MEPVLDPNALNALREISGNDESWFVDLLKLSVDSGRTELTALLAASHQKDAARLQGCAHKLKGQSSYIGANRLVSLLQKVMHTSQRSVEAGNAGDPYEARVLLDEAKSYVPSVVNEFARVERAVQQLLTSHV